MSNKRDWASEVAAWRASGKTAREFCEERGYSTTRLYWWSSQMKRAGKAETREAVPLARVIRKKDAIGSRVPRKPVIVHIGDARVEVVADADPAALTVALKALAATSWSQCCVAIPMSWSERARFSQDDTARAMG